MLGIRITAVDWCVLVLYLVTIAAISIIASRKVKTTENYFLGNRRFGKWTMIAQSFGTGTHAEMPVSLAGAVYSMGLSGIWFQWKSLFVTPFYWMLAPLFRRFRRTTMAEVISDRYGPWMGVAYTLFALCFFMISMASMLKGAGKAIDQAVGGQLPVNDIVIAMAAIFMLYSFFGGLLATAWIDLLQGLLIIVLSFMVIPLGWKTVGGIGGIRATLGASHLSLTLAHGIGPGFIAILTLNGLVGIMAQPHLIAAVGTGRDERTCRIGQLYGNFVKRVCTVGWALVGLIAAAMIARDVTGTSRLADPEGAFGFACRHLLFPGGVGLLTASFLAASMAACSAFMVDSAAMFTNGLYRKHFVRRGSDRHYLLVGQISGLAVAAVAVLYALFFIQRVLYSFLLGETMAAFVGISVIGGIVWRRGNRWGAAASIVTAIAVNFAGYALRGQRLDAWSRGVFLAAFSAGVATFILVSLLSPAETAPETEAFLRDLQSPSDSGGSPPSPRAVAEAGGQLVLVNLLHLRRGAQGVGLFKAYRRDLAGFAWGAILVAGLIYLVWLMSRI